MNKIKPGKEAMLICDSIITEVTTNKKSLIGIFEEIATTQFPFRHASLSVYVKFTGAMGEYQFKLELVDLQTGDVNGRGVIGPLKMADKLASYELVFNLKGLEFKHPGKYEFRIFADEELFGTKSFAILQHQTQQPPPSPPA
ncbi:MAG: hypothetical protein HYZ84_06840 [Candidatus Omnitrophica bacterium]|nr:hypothetical protein [Candidatus Omnitrophota bacterium]